MSNAEVVHPSIEHLAEDTVAIADQARRRRGAGTERLHELLCSPRRVGLCRDVHMEHAPPLERQHEEHVQHPKVTVGTVRKSMASV